jgi:hypothetical protein
MKLPFCEVVGSFNPGGYRRLQLFAQGSQGEVAVLSISHKITFFSPPGGGGGQFTSNSGELANGLFRERFDNA